MAMSNAERLKKRRETLKQQNLKTMLVRGKDGEYDERIRLALAIKELAYLGKIPEEILNMLIDTAVEVIPPKDNVNKLAIKKLIKNYLYKE